MTGTQGQASVEWAGLLALAAVLGAGLALIAAPPLVHAIHSALVSALSADAPGGGTPVVVTAADIADVQAALAAPGEALTPDAALLALGRRHGSTRAAEIADELLLETARNRSPWLGGSRTYRAWTHWRDGPYGPVTRAGGDHDVETPTGHPVVTWITVAAQRGALVHALSHHTDGIEIGVALVAFAPGGKLAGEMAETGARGAARTAITRVPKVIDETNTGLEVAALVRTDDDGVPGGLRAGDVMVSWPVHRTAWRGGHVDPSPRVDFGSALGSHELPDDYEHVVYLRPVAGGLAIVGEQSASEAA